MGILVLQIPILYPSQPGTTSKQKWLAKFTSLTLLGGTSMSVVFSFLNSIRRSSAQQRSMARGVLCSYVHLSEFVSCVFLYVCVFIHLFLFFVCKFFACLFVLFVSCWGSFVHPLNFYIASLSIILLLPFC